MDIKQKKVLELARKLQLEWIKRHKDWRTPVWGYFRDKAEELIIKKK